MLFDLLIAACGALAAVGVALVGVRLLGRKAPRWVVPVAAALGMVGVTAAVRYQWAGHAESLLPPGMVVLERLRETSPLEPWSYLRPMVTALVVADGAGLRRNPAHPGKVLADVLLVRRGEPTLVARHLVDCGTRKDAVLPPGWDGEAPLPPLDWSSGGPAGLADLACRPPAG